MIVALVATLLKAVRWVADWHIPLALVVAAGCLVGAVSFPILVVREFLVYGQELSILDGVEALLSEGDWVLASILVLFSIVVPLIKMGILLVIWWRLRRGRLPGGWITRSLEWSSRWAMLDVFVVALVIVFVKAHAFGDAHVAGAVYPFVAAVALLTYAAHAIASAQGARQLA